MAECGEAKANPNGYHLPEEDLIAGCFHGEMALVELADPSREIEGGPRRAPAKRRCLVNRIARRKTE